MCLCLVHTVTLQRPAHPYKAILFQCKRNFQEGEMPPQFLRSSLMEERSRGSRELPEMASRGGAALRLFCSPEPFPQLPGCGMCCMRHYIPCLRGMKSALPTPRCLCVSPSSPGSGESRSMGGWKPPFGLDALICGDLIVSCAC